MEDDDDDFTFPTAVVAVPEERRDVGTVATPTARLGDPAGSAAPGPGGASSRLWPFAAPLIAGAAPAASMRTEEEEEEERGAVVEDRMDMLWDDTAAAASTWSGGGRAKAEHPAAAKAKTADETTDERAAEQERMDLLWESFNEELLLLRRARSKSYKAGKHHPGPPLPEPADSWYLCPSSTSDAESEGEASSAVSTSSPRYGCAPTMLRASSRAGGAGRFCGSPTPRRSRSSRGGGWALLLRLFRRLFAVDNKAAAPAPRRHGIHVP